MHELSKLEIALMALRMADGWLPKAKLYAEGEYIQPETWALAVDEFHKEGVCIPEPLSRN